MWPQFSSSNEKIDSSAAKTTTWGCFPNLRILRVMDIRNRGSSLSLNYCWIVQMGLWESCITCRHSYLYTCFSGICSFITTNVAYQDRPTYPDTLTGPCLDKVEPSRDWVRGGSSELATGICPAYRLTASDGSRLKNNTQWKSRAGSVVSMANGGGGSEENRERTECAFFCADVWMWVLTVHLALVTISQAN